MNAAAEAVTARAMCERIKLGMDITDLIELCPGALLVTDRNGLTVMSVSVWYNRHHTTAMIEAALANLPAFTWL